MKRLSLNSWIFLSILLAVATGLVFRGEAAFLKPYGMLFISLLKMLISPIVFFSVTAGIVSLPRLGALKRLAGTTSVYYLVTPAIAIATGLLLVHLIRPGVYSDTAALHAVFNPDTASGAMGPPDAAGFARHLLESLFVNPFKALSETDVLPVILFAVAIGIGIYSLGARGKILADTCTAGSELFMLLLNWIMVLAPFGLFCLIAATVGTLGFEAVRLLGWFVVTVIAGILFHGLVSLMVILRVFGKRPYRTLKEMTEPLFVAFSTSSSNATLPVTLRCARERLGISPATAQFVIPIGATVNMDGTALYEAVAAVFIAQVYGIHLSVPQEIVLFLMAMLTSIGAPGIPSAGMVTMLAVLKAVGLPLEGIALLLTVDRFLDMFRTTVNVQGDLIGACVVERFLGRDHKGKAGIESL